MQHFFVNFNKKKNAFVHPTSFQICVRSMAQVSDCINHMIKGMDARPDVVGAACEALHKMFDRNHTELVAQVNSHFLCR